MPKDTRPATGKGSGYLPSGVHARQVYTLEQIDHALTLYAMCGSYKVVAQETGISRYTIAHWRNEKHYDRYKRIAEQVEAEVADRLNGLVKDRLDLLEKSRDKLNAAFDANDTSAVKDLAAADRNLAVSAGLGSDKSRSIREKPNFVVQSQVSTSELASELARLSPAIAKS
jgi:hypothetical protein